MAIKKVEATEEEEVKHNYENENKKISFLKKNNGSKMMV